MFLPGVRCWRGILLRNASSWMPSFSVRVVPAKRKIARHWRWEAATFAWPPNRSPEQQWLRLPDRRLRRVNEEQDRPVLQQSVYFPFLPPAEELRADLEISFPRAGVIARRISAWLRVFPLPS